MELVHSHTLHFVKNQGVPEQQSKRCACIQQGVTIETQTESLQYYRGAVLEDWSEVVEACSQPALCGSATALNSIYHYGVMIHTNNYTYTGSVSVCNYPVGGRSMTVVRRERR